MLTDCNTGVTSQYRYKVAARAVVTNVLTTTLLLIGGT
jgi:hypothetical protein